MAITLSANPEEIQLARNPVLVRLRADQDGFGTLFDAVGVTAEVEYTETQRFDTNETLTVEYEEPDGTTTTVVFTAKAVYDNENEIPDNSFGGTDSEYWIAVKDRVKKHRLIAPFFTVYLIASPSQKLVIIEKTGDPDWTVTVTNTGGFTVNDVAATADATPDNYRPLLDVFLERTYLTGDYTLAAQLQGAQESGTGYVYFDLSSVLTAECRAARAEPLVPEWGTSAPALADNFRRWYFRYTEEYGSPVERQDWQPSLLKMCVDGGVSQALFAEGDFLGAMDEENSLLTWMPDGRKIGVNQPEYMAWFNNGGTLTVYVRVLWYDITDGSASSPTSYYTPGLAVQHGEVALFPVGPAMFGLDAEPNAYKYTVTVGYTAIGFSALSQTRTYYIDRDYYESERYVQYLNGLGVPETWRCRGEIGKRLKVERQTAEKPLLPGYNELASDRFQHSRVWDNELIYRTGYLTKAEAEALQELLIAGEVYDVSADGYIPLQIVSNSFKVTETRQELHSYEFTALPRLSMKNFSRKGAGTMGTDEWLDEAGESWWDTITVAWEVP